MSKLWWFSPLIVLALGFGLSVCVVQQIQEAKIEAAERAERMIAVQELHRKVQPGPMVPHFDRVENGLRVTAIDENGGYARLGIQSGDILQKINGDRIASDLDLFDAYGKHKSAQAITVDLQRKGKPVQLYLEAGDGAWRLRSQAGP